MLARGTGFGPVRSSADSQKEKDCLKMMKTANLKRQGNYSFETRT
jgi:hypothetical protein